MKTMRKPAALLLVCFMILSLAACKSEADKEAEKQAELQKQVEATLFGVWEIRTADSSIRYIFDANTIEQAATIYDADGTERDISIGNKFKICFRAVSENEIELYSVMGGQETIGDKVAFERIDENTLDFGGTRYVRFTGK